MKVKFKGQHSSEEVLESLHAIMRMFEEQYHVLEFNNIKLTMTLINDVGEEVELIDASTSEVFEILEVHKTDELENSQEASAEEGQDYVDLEIDSNDPKRLH